MMKIVAGRQKPSVLVWPTMKVVEGRLQHSVFDWPTMHVVEARHKHSVFVWPTMKVVERRQSFNFCMAYNESCGRETSIQFLNGLQYMLLRGDICFQFLSCPH